jgi:hypothetical protein
MDRAADWMVPSRSTRPSSSTCPEPMRGAPRRPETESLIWTRTDIS